MFLPILLIVFSSIINNNNGLIITKEEDSNNDLVIAVVANQYDKYALQDNYILDGAEFFARWTNQHGGFQYHH